MSSPAEAGIKISKTENSSKKSVPKKAFLKRQLDTS
jgi:hypothetical protein